MSPDKNQLSKERNSWTRTNRAYKTQRQTDAVYRGLMRHREWRGYVRWSEVACAIFIGWIINQCNPRFRFKIHVVNIPFFDNNITHQRSTVWLYPVDESCWRGWSILNFNVSTDTLYLNSLFFVNSLLFVSVLMILYLDHVSLVYNLFIKWYSVCLEYSSIFYCLSVQSM